MDGLSRRGGRGVLRAALLTSVLASGLLVGGPTVASAATPPGGEVSRTPITTDELRSGAAPSGLTVNAGFAPPEGHARRGDRSSARYTSTARR